MIIESQAIAQKRIQEGYTYQQERGYDVAEKMAQNEGVGEFANMGIGLGMMTGVGGTIGGMMSSMFTKWRRVSWIFPSNEKFHCYDFKTLGKDT